MEGIVSGVGITVREAEVVVSTRVTEDADDDAHKETAGIIESRRRFAQSHALRRDLKSE